MFSLQRDLLVCAVQRQGLCPSLPCPRHLTRPMAQVREDPASISGKWLWDRRLEKGVLPHVSRRSQDLMCFALDGVSPLDLSTIGPSTEEQDRKETHQVLSVFTLRPECPFQGAALVLCLEGQTLRPLMGLGSGGTTYCIHPLLVMLRMECGSGRVGKDSVNLVSVQGQCRVSPEPRGGHTVRPPGPSMTQLGLHLCFSNSRTHPSCCLVTKVKRNSAEMPTVYCYLFLRKTLIGFCVLWGGAAVGQRYSLAQS